MFILAGIVSIVLSRCFKLRAASFEPKRREADDRDKARPNISRGLISPQLSRIIVRIHISFCCINCLTVQLPRNRTNERITLDLLKFSAYTHLASILPSIRLCHSTTNPAPVKPPHTNVFTSIDCIYKPFVLIQTTTQNKFDRPIEFNLATLSYLPRA